MTNDVQWAMRAVLSEDPCPESELRVREVVGTFATLMERKLAKNDHKTSWRTLPIEALRKKLEIEMEEFKVALEYEGLGEAMNELVDVANFCLILWDRLRAEQEKPKREAPDGQEPI